MQSLSTGVFALLEVQLNCEVTSSWESRHWAVCKKIFQVSPEISLAVFDPATAPKHPHEYTHVQGPGEP